MSLKAVQDLTDALKAVEKPSTKGCVGITTFIKTELIADGKDKPAVQPPGGFVFSANAASAGLYKGRKFDTAFQRAVGFNEHTAQTRQAFKALKNIVNVVPVLCQHRVVMESTKLTTQLDAVGIDLRTHIPVCIELKTCQLSSVVYNKYATTVCRRTPILRCSPELPNCERVRHFLQAAFGAECLRKQLGVDKVLAVVLVKCKDACMVYRVPQSYHAPTRFVRLPPVPILRQSAKQDAATKRQSEKINSLPWPTEQAESVVKAMGFKAVKVTGPGSMKFRIMTKASKATAVALHIHSWSTLPSFARTHLRTAIAQFTQRARPKIALAGLQLSKLVTPLVLTELTPGGRLQLIMAGPPFTVQSI